MMNRYFILSFLSLGLMFGLYIFTSFFISAANAFDGIDGGHPLEARLSGLPIWMYMLMLFTLGIFFLIFGIKQKMFLESKNKPQV